MVAELTGMCRLTRFKRSLYVIPFRCGTEPSQPLSMACGMELMFVLNISFPRYMSTIGWWVWLSCCSLSSTAWLGESGRRGKERKRKRKGRRDKGVKDKERMEGRKGREREKKQCTIVECGLNSSYF